VRQKEKRNGTGQQSLFEDANRHSPELDDWTAESWGKNMQSTAATILCCLCGCDIKPNSANMCDQCLQTQVDITEGIPKQVIIHHCRGCERFLRPPWVAVQPESRELLAVCLRKIRGLNKVKLIDAGFIWTEPHSKRIKVRLTIQKEVFSGVVLQQVFPVEFVVTNMFCDDCHAQAASNTWTACVQVRQRVPHKRTILFLEQLILKHDAHSYALSIKSQPDGIDFFFGERSHALRFINFVESVTPLRTRSAKELVSADLKSNVMSYKFTYMSEIVPLCKHDIMALPKTLASKCGQINQIVLCERVTTGVHIIDPRTGQRSSFPQDRFWHLGPFSPMATAPQMIQFIVLDCELLDVARGDASIGGSGSSSSHSGHDANRGGNNKRKRGEDSTSMMMQPQRKRGGRVGIVELVKVTDFGLNDTKYTCTTHLGHLLKSGDHVLGFDMAAVNANPADTQGIHENKMPNIVLVRKYYPKTYAQLAKHGRGWKLKVLNVEDEAIDYGINDKKLKKKQLKKDLQNAAQRAADLEAVMQDLQEDPEMRSKINLYRDEKYNGLSTVTGLASRGSGGSSSNSHRDTKMSTVSGDDDDDSELEDDFPEIQLSELMDDLSMGMGQGNAAGNKGAGNSVGDDDGRTVGTGVAFGRRKLLEGQVFMGKTKLVSSKGVTDDILTGVNFTGVQGKEVVELNQTTGTLVNPEDDDDL